MQRRTPTSRVRSMTFIIMAFNSPIMPMMTIGMPIIARTAMRTRLPSRFAARST